MFIPVSVTTGSGETSYNRQIDGTARAMEAFGKHAEDMSEPLGELGDILHLSLAQQFATQGAAGAGGQWAPLSPVYGAWKARHSSSPILVGLQRTGSKGHRPQTYKPSGQMREQLLDPAAMHVDPRRLLYAPVSDIAGYHESGTSKMPARPPLDLTLENLRAFDRTFVRWLGKLVDESGLA